MKQYCLVKLYNVATLSETVCPVGYSYVGSNGYVRLTGTHFFRISRNLEKVDGAQNWTYCPRTATTFKILLGFCVALVTQNPKLCTVEVVHNEGPTNAETPTDGVDSITSTADMGGNY